MLLIFAFAFLGGERPGADVSAGVLWVAIALAGTVGISRAFEREREGDTLRALLLAPVSRAALYLSKLCAISLLMVLVEIVEGAAPEAKPAEEERRRRLLRRRGRAGREQGRSQEESEETAPAATAPEPEPVDEAATDGVADEEESPVDE